ncbi:MAG: hypothetical protein GY788_07880 [bacterium]|nr:hypothetical protein [bacterium]
MFTDLIEYPIESEKLRYEARMVLRDFDDAPHMLLRLKLTGTRFPQRALLPFVRVGGEILAFDTEIAANEMSVAAYFDRPLPERGQIEFGYGTTVYLRLVDRFMNEGLEPLDPALIPDKTRLTERFHPGD